MRTLLANWRWAIALLALSFPAFAEESIEEVIVTGSYIRGAAEDAPLPITTLQREDLALQGSPSAIDLIKSLSFSQGADGETDQFQAGAGAERASVNIRGLGPSRTLVLLNGKRITWSPIAIPAQAQLLVDVNMIPAIALQRVELLRDGAAATYGSDAIAGVTNFITRSDFEGFEVSASHKAIADTDGDSDFGAIWGSSFMGGRLHVVTSFGYAERSQLRIADRDWALLPYAESTRGGWSGVGRPAIFVPYDRFGGTSGGFGGLLQAGINDPNCALLGGTVDSTGVPGGFPADGMAPPPVHPDPDERTPYGGFCRFQYTAFDNLIEDIERWQWMTEASFEINDTTTLSLEFLLGNSKVPNWATSPSYPPNRLVDRSRSLRANNPGLIDMAAKYPNVYGKYCQDVNWQPDPDDPTATDPCTYQGDPWDEIAWFYGRYYGQDGPPRSHHRESDMMRFVAELEGEFADMDWLASLSYSKAERETGQGDTMAYRDERAREGLGGHECEAMVPNEYVNGELQFSLATLQKYAGKGPCQYWIPFSNSMPGSHPLVRDGQPVNPDFNPLLSNQPLLDYMITEGVSLGEASLLTLEGVVTGEIPWNLRGGSVDFAAGFQYRDETYQTRQQDGSFYDGDLFPCSAGPEIKDCTTGRTGLFNFLPPGFTIDDDRNIWAVFGEFRFPFTNNFEMQLSARHENYGGSTGSTTDPKLALRWQISRSFGVRGSVGTTFRGPTLNQTVPTNSSNSLQFIAQTGAFKRVDTRGNPNLTPEEAETANIGLLIDRDGVFSDSDNLFITVDYWRYDFTDPLVTEPFANIVRLACPGTPASPCDKNSPYYDRLIFGGNDSATDIEIINVNIVNGPDYATDGIDFTVRYSFQAGPGYLSVDATGTKIQSFDIDAWEFGAEYDALGRLNYNTSLARTLAEVKGRVSFNYAWQELNVRWVTSYVDSYKYQGASPQPAGDAIVPSHTTHDIHLTYDFLDGFRIHTSIINLEDDDPPHMSREFNYDAFTHNPFGRMFRLGLTYSL